MRRIQDTTSFNQRHPVRALSPVTPWQQVCVKTQRLQARWCSLISSHIHISYSSSGTTRRDREHLLLLSDPTQRQSAQSLNSLIHRCITHSQIKQELLGWTCKRVIYLIDKLRKDANVILFCFSSWSQCCCLGKKQKNCSEFAQSN